MYKHIQNQTFVSFYEVSISK